MMAFQSLRVLVEPVISEKSTFVADKYRQYVFRVLPEATKSQIKIAVEAFFKVRVTTVQVLNVKGKAKKFGRHWGCRKNYKKAFVCLEPNQEINFTAEI